MFFLEKVVRSQELLFPTLYYLILFNTSREKLSTGKIRALVSVKTCNNKM